jgi:hypothetical protein
MISILLMIMASDDYMSCSRSKEEMGTLSN